MGKLNRYAEMDGLRAVAAAAVVLIHVSAGRGDTASIACNQLARFAVPLFLMLSGFGHAAEIPSGTGWWADCRRRLGRVLPPYFVWSAAYLLLDAAVGKPHAHPVRDLLTGSVYMHLYYIFILVQFILLCRPLRYAVERFPDAALAAAAAVSFAMQCVLCLQALGKITLPCFPIPPVLWFAPWLLFYVGGMWLRRHPPLPASGRRLAAAAAVLGLCVAAVLLVAKRYPALRPLSFRPDLTWYTFAAWAGLWRLCGSMGQLPHSRMHSERFVSFGLYLSHPLVMRLWTAWAGRREPPIYLQLWQSWLLAFAGGLLAALALSRLPHGELLGGAKKAH